MGHPNDETIGTAERDTKAKSLDVRTLHLNPIRIMRDTLHEVCLIEGNHPFGELDIEMRIIADRDRYQE